MPRPKRNEKNRMKRVAAIVGLCLIAAGAFAQEAAPAKKETTAWEMIKHGGPTLVVVVICSVYPVTLIIERFMFYREAQGDTIGMLTKIKQAGTLAEALSALEHAPGISGRILRTALESSRDGYSPEQVEQLVQGEATKELIGMEKFLPQLDSMVTMCPLIGLLGTTIGMIRSFSIVAAIGMSDATKLAGGIAEAVLN